MICVWNDMLWNFRSCEEKLRAAVGRDCDGLDKFQIFTARAANPHIPEAVI